MKQHIKNKVCTVPCAKIYSLPTQTCA